MVGKELIKLVSAIGKKNLSYEFIKEALKPW